MTNTRGRIATVDEMAYGEFEFHGACAKRSVRGALAKRGNLLYYSKTGYFLRHWFACIAFWGPGAKRKKGRNEKGENVSYDDGFARRSIDLLSTKLFALFASSSFFFLLFF